MHRVIKLNQKAWFNSYIDLNTELRKNEKNDFKFFFQLVNNAIFGKTIENIRKGRDVRLIETGGKSIYLKSESNFYTTNSYSKIFT